MMYNKKVSLNGESYDIHVTITEKHDVTLDDIRNINWSPFTNAIADLTTLVGGKINGRNIPVVDITSHMFYPTINCGISYKENRSAAIRTTFHVKRAIEHNLKFGQHCECKNYFSGLTEELLNGHEFIYAIDAPLKYLQEIYKNLKRNIDNWNSVQEAMKKMDEKNGEEDIKKPIEEPNVELIENITEKLNSTANPYYDEKGNREIGYLLTNIKALKNSVNFLTGVLNANRKLFDARRSIEDIKKFCIEIPKQIDFIESREIIISQQVSLTDKDITQLRKLVGDKDAENVLNLLGINWK